MKLILEERRKINIPITKHQIVREEITKWQCLEKLKEKENYN